MKKYIIIFIELVCFCLIPYSCSQSFKQKFEATLFWEKNVMPVFQLDNNPYIEFKIRTIFSDTLESVECAIIRTESFEAYLNDDWEKYYLFTEDSVWMVNIGDCELMQGQADSGFYEAWHGQTIHLSTNFIQPFLYPTKIKYQFDNIRDTILNGIKYKILRRKFKNSYTYNEESQQYDIPNFHIVDYYFNTTTRLIDHISANPTSESIRSWKEDYYIEYSFKDSANFVKQIFDFNNPQYANYSRHNDDKLPYSWSFSDETPSSLSRQVLDFPIVSLKNDTTSIAEEDGWLLLDFWWFSCRSCIEWVATTSKEKTEYGQRVLELNGIKIMSINAISNNQEKLTETAKKYNAADIIYHAKGMGELINIYYMPQYYLVSPDKKIVLKTNELGDYSEVLKVKQKWESKHKRK